MGAPAEARLVTEPLGRDHDRAAFRCGRPSLDRYLQAQARQDGVRRVGQTFVAVETGAEAPKPVVGYYTLIASSVELAELPPEQRRVLPRYPHVPVGLIGRLAVASARQGRRIGEFLLMDAMRRVLEVSEQMGICMIVVDALDDDAARFYARYGFVGLPATPNRLFLPLAVFEREFSKR